MERLTEERRKLAASALPIAEAIAERYARTFPSRRADLQSSAAFGVLRAATAYYQGGLSWEELAKFYARMECSTTIRKHLKSCEVSIEEVSLDVEPSYNKERDLVAGIEAFADLVKSLPSPHRSLCEYVYVNDLTIEEAASKLGYAPKYGHHLHRHSLARIRARISN